MAEELVKSLDANEVFSFTLFGYKVAVTDTVVVMWLIMAAVILIAFLATRKMVPVPKGRQNYVEAAVELWNNFCKTNIGHHWRHFAPYLGTLMIFLIMANTVSIFSIIPSSEQLYELTHFAFLKSLPVLTIRPPTKDVNVTAALAVMSIFMVLFSGIRFKKVSGWLKGFIQPMPLILPFRILDYFVRPLSLCFRLFGNILGAFFVMELLYAVMPLVLPAFVSIYFDLFDGILQAFIFVFLTTLYISEAVET